MNKFNFKRVIDNIEQVKRELPRILANDAQNYFLSSWKKQGYNGKSWAEVQRRMPDTAAYKYAKPKSGRTKPILIGTGRLRRAVSNIAGRARITYSKYNFNVKLEIDKNTVPYADYINKGTTKMVARQFMGNAPELRRIMRDRMKRYFDKALKA